MVSLKNRKELTIEEMVELQFSKELYGILNFFPEIINPTPELNSNSFARQLVNMGYAIPIDNEQKK